MVSMQRVSWHGARWNVILWGDVVPIDRFQYWTILSSCNSLNGPMTSFHNSVSTWWVGTPKPQMHVPIPHKFSKVFTRECGVIVGQYFHQWASLEENILQLSDNSGHILLAQWSPYCKSRGAAVDDRKFSPLWWVMSITNLFQLSVTPNSPFFQQTGAGSIDRQVSQVFTTESAVSLHTCESTNLAKYKVHFAPGCPLWWWMSATWSLSSRLLTIAQLSNTGSFPSLSKSIHMCGTLLRLSARFWQDFVSFTLMVSPYSFASDHKVPSRRLTSISLAALVFTRALPVKVSEIPRCMHTESVTKCNTVASHWRAKLIPLRVASSSARLMCWASLIGRSQHASSMTIPFVSNATPVATELASTQTVISLPSVHQFPPMGSASHSLVKVSANIWLREAFLILSSQPLVTAVAKCFINATATLSHPHTGKWPTSFPQRENTRRRVNLLGISGIWLPCFYQRVPFFSQTCKPRTLAPPYSSTGSLETKP